jgi:SOS-response transcriptional repressor LexA
VREIQLLIGLASVSTVHAHLAILRDAHLIDWVDGSNRTLHLTDLGAGFVL